MPCRRPDPDALAALRAHIGAIECDRDDEAAAVVPVGASAIDGALPGGGLAQGCLHEVVPGEPLSFSSLREEKVRDEEGGRRGLARSSNADIRHRHPPPPTPSPRERAEGAFLAASPPAEASVAAAASGFTAALLGRFAAVRQGFLLWCLAGGDLYAPGLARFGIAHDRLIVVRARRRDEVLWVLEEALRSARLAAVVGEVDGIDLTASRRLQLAARTGGTACLLLRGTRRRAKAGKETSAAVTRWGVTPAPSMARPAPAWSSSASEPRIPAPTGHPPGPRPEGEDRASQIVGSRPTMTGNPARWRVALLRSRGGRPQEWLVDWDDATHRFAVVPALGDRAPVPARRTG